MQLSANQKVVFKLSIVGLLIVAAVFSRFWLVDWPNFKPVAAVAIFAGFLLGSRWLVWMVPLLILFLSDWRIGFYDWGVMVSVYLRPASFDKRVSVQVNAWRESHSVRCRFPFCFFLLPMRRWFWQVGIHSLGQGFSKVMWRDCRF